MTDPAIRPLHDFVLLRRIKQETESRGGIIIPATAQERATHGDVLAVGPGKTLNNGKRLEPGVKVGDRVLFGKYHAGHASRSSQLDDDILILREEEIMAVVT